MSRACKIEGCDRPSRVRDMCRSHYQWTWDRAKQKYRTWRDYDVDEMSVQRFVDGDPPARFGLWERREAVRVMTERGMSAREIGERVGVSGRQVQRDRARLAEKTSVVVDRGNGRVCALPVPASTATSSVTPAATATGYKLTAANTTELGAARDNKSGSARRWSDEPTLTEHLRTQEVG